MNKQKRELAIGRLSFWVAIKMPTLSFNKRSLMMFKGKTIRAITNTSYNPLHGLVYKVKKLKQIVNIWESWLFGSCHFGSWSACQLSYLKQ